MRPCWILTYGRTGSTYLSRLLNSTNAFDPLFYEHYGEHRDVEEVPPAYNKMMNIQYRNAKKKGQILNEYYPDMCFVYLRRKNIVAAAVSKYFVDKTNVYNHNVAQKVKKYKHKEIPYHRDELIKAYQIKLTEYHFWDAFVQDKDHIEVYYEDVIANPEKQVRRVMKIVGAEFNGFHPDKNGDNLFMELTVKLEHPDKDRYTRRLRKELTKRGILA